MQDAKGEKEGRREKGNRKKKREVRWKEMSG